MDKDDDSMTISVPDLLLSSEQVNDKIKDIIDAGLEISQEEQRKIVAQIDSLIEKSRRSLAIGKDPREASGTHFKAKKSGGLFPILVNVFAALALVGGYFMMYSFQNDADVNAREGTRIFNDAERRLIDEIRRETTALLGAMDSEISMLLTTLNDIEAQLREFMRAGVVLTPEQVVLRDQLLARQEEGAAALAQARDDRSRLLDYARSQESVVRVQVDERARGATEDRVSYDAYADTHAEFAELAAAQAQASMMESQIAGLFANVHGSVAERNFDKAEEIIGSMREFLDSPVFQTFPALQSRRGLYVHAADTLETLLREYRITYAYMLAGVLPTPEPEPVPEPDTSAEDGLRDEIARLERLTAERVGSLEGRIRALQAEHSAEIYRMREENETLRNHLWQTVQTLQALQ